MTICLKGGVIFLGVNSNTCIVGGSKIYVHMKLDVKQCRYVLCGTLNFLQTIPNILGARIRGEVVHKFSTSLHFASIVKTDECILHFGHTPFSKHLALDCNVQALNSSLGIRNIL